MTTKTKTLLKRVNPEDRDRLAAAVRFYIERCQWGAEPAERAEFVRLYGDICEASGFEREEVPS